MVCGNRTWIREAAKSLQCGGLCGLQGAVTAALPRSLRQDRGRPAKYVKAPAPQCNVSDHEHDSVPTEPPGCCGESPPTVGRLQVPVTDVAVAELAANAGKFCS